MLSQLADAENPFRAAAAHQPAFTPIAITASEGTVVVAVNERTELPKTQLATRLLLFDQPRRLR